MRRIIALLLAALAVVATIVVILLMSVQRSLLNAETYQRAFNRNGVYERLPASATGQLSLAQSTLADSCAGSTLACAIQRAAPKLQTCLKDGLGENVVEEIASGSRPPDETEAEAAQGCLDRYGTSAEVPSSRILGVEGMVFLNNLTPDQWDVLIVHLLPSGDLQTMTESTLDEIIAYFKGETNIVQMPLVNLKARLTGKAGAELTLLLLESQPPCTQEQQTQIMAGDFGDEGTAPIFCSTTGETQVLISTELQRRLKNVATEIPDHASLIKPPSPSIPARFQILLGEDRQSALQRINAGIPYSPLLPLVLLLLIALFAVRSLRGWLRWWGIPVFIASIITLTIGIFSFFMFDWIWVKTILPYIPPSLTSGFGEISHDVAHSLVSDLAPWVMLGAGIVALPALGMIVASFHVAPPPDPSLPPLALPGTPGGPVVSQSKSKRRKKGW